MILIVYGEKNELFKSNSYNVPDAIIELYKYGKGGIDDDLFEAAISGMVRKDSTSDIVRMYNVLACEKPIRTIFTGVNEFWKEAEA